MRIKLKFNEVSRNRVTDSGGGPVIFLMLKTGIQGESHEDIAF